MPASSSLPDPVFLKPIALGNGPVRVVAVEDDRKQDRNEICDRIDGSKTGSFTMGQDKASFKKGRNLDQTFKRSDGDAEGKETRAEFVNPSAR